MRPFTDQHNIMARSHDSAPIVDHYGDPIANARVEAYDVSDDSLQETAYTNDSGIASFVALHDTNDTDLKFMWGLFQVEWRRHIFETGGGGGTPAADHGALTGLGDDDHGQYHTNTRGDARYYTKTLLDAGQLDNRYYTETEVAGFFTAHGVAGDPHAGYRLESADHSHQSAGAQAGKLDHGAALDGKGDNDHTQYILHALATAVNNFLVASGSGAYVKKTLAEVKTLLAIANDIATHAALPISGSVHPNTHMARVSLGTDMDAITDNKYVRIELDTEQQDPGSNFASAADWYTGTCEDGTNATNIEDTGAFTDNEVLRCKISWTGVNTGWGIITARPDNNNVTIVKVSGDDPAENDTYHIRSAHYVVPASGYYMVAAAIAWQWNTTTAGKRYRALLYEDNTIRFDNNFSAGGTDGLTTPAVGMLHFTAGGLVTLVAIHYAGGGNEPDIDGGTYLTWMSIHLVQAD